MTATAPVRLTSYSHGAGCACKLGPNDLAQVLSHIPVATDARVLVDASNRDDAAVFKLTDDRALVATVDFFTPVVDDPYDFGRVAAANAFSDVYAMGGTPLLALNLVGWPREKLPFELLGEILRGGTEIAHEAGAFVLGGHSVDDPEPKYGMVAIGEVHPDRIVTNAGAQPGDVLILTKPIGTGVLTTALKRDLLPAPELAPAVRSMTTLNAGAGRALRAAPVHAATDVTGFGLLGHLNSVLRASRAAADLEAGSVPLLPRVREMALKGAIPSGTKRNLASVAQAVTFDPAMAEVDRLILADAQTSGGLLISAPESSRDQLLAALKREGTLAAAVIGRVRAGEPGSISVR
ncbi:MAG TPA: selenide, water dikinase SelD [Gemmatimonadales bacterium]|nr:selenide, water dikinase SelD [Gemmatimonadales bacterium]